jgi:CheY-like chemotaxis protein
MGAHVQLRVSDSGQGISPEFLPFVFDRFRQADSTSTRSHGGLGIGLTIVRHIIELHGGTVSAQSRGEGQGSVFTVTLPITATAADSDQPAAPAATTLPGNGHPSATAHDNAAAAAADSSAPDALPMSRLRNGDLAGVRILLVDDAPDALDVLAAILRRAKADVTTAPSAADARRILQELRPHVLVSDIAMPDEDGFALIQSVRALSPELGGNIPAVALTAYAREEDRLKALGAGFQAHLAKPVEPDELITMLLSLASTVSPPPQTLVPAASNS